MREHRSPPVAARQSASASPARRRRRAARALAALLGAAALALAPAACARAKRPAAAVAAEPEEPVTVQVQNRNRSDVVVYAVRGNTRTRLGLVATGGRQTFTLPAVFSGDAGGFALFGDPVGDRGTVQSERLLVQPGQRVVWWIEARLTQSTVAVY